MYKFLVLYQNRVNVSLYTKSTVYIIQLIICTKLNKAYISLSHSSLLKLPTTLMVQKTEGQSCSRLSVPLHPGPIMVTGMKGNGLGFKRGKRLVFKRRNLLVELVVLGSWPLL